MVMRGERVTWRELVERSTGDHPDYAYVPASLLLEIKKRLHIIEPDTELFIYCPMGGDLGRGRWTVMRLFDQNPLYAEGYYHRVVDKFDDSIVPEWVYIVSEPSPTHEEIL
jgi:hypothetical protein